MALMVSQAQTGLQTPTYSTPTTSDTITYEPGLLLYVKVGGTATTVTMVVPGNQVYTGTAITDASTGSISNADRTFFITRDLIDTSTNLITVTYSQVTAVTAALLRVGA